MAATQLLQTLGKLMVTATIMVVVLLTVVVTFLLCWLPLR
jgi:hypothetical protein